MEITVLDNGFNMDELAGPLACCFEIAAPVI